MYSFEPDDFTYSPATQAALAALPSDPTDTELCFALLRHVRDSLRATRELAFQDYLTALAAGNQFEMEAAQEVYNRFGRAAEYSDIASTWLYDFF